MHKSFISKFRVQVHANGVITFDSLSTALPEGTFPNGTASIAPFWTAVDQESTTSNVYYRVTDDSTLVGNLTTIVRDSFRGSTVEFNASQMLIVTWDRVKGVGTGRVWSMQERERERERCQCENSRVCVV